MSYQDLVGKKTNYGVVKSIRPAGGAGSGPFGWVSTEDGSEFFILLNTLVEVPREKTYSREEIINFGRLCYRLKWDRENDSNIEGIFADFLRKSEEKNK